MSVFDDIVPLYMARLMADFDCTAEDAAAVFGNAGHESAGFEKLQEIAPVVKGSAGGWGWFQWTGPRRRAFDRYCERHGLDKSAHETQYKFLYAELTTTEKRTMPAVMAAQGLDAKVRVFEQMFERAGVKHYPSRIRWAKRALAAYHRAPPDTETTAPSVPYKVHILDRMLGWFFDFILNLWRKQ